MLTRSLDARGGEVTGFFWIPGQARNDVVERWQAGVERGTSIDDSNVWDYSNTSCVYSHCAHWHTLAMIFRPSGCPFGLKGSH